MGEKGMERRLCQRFKIDGATVSYRRARLFSSKAKVDEEFCPVLDLSRGGVRFLTQKPLKFKSKVSVQLAIPGERASSTSRAGSAGRPSTPARATSSRPACSSTRTGSRRTRTLPRP